MRIHTLALLLIAQLASAVVSAQSAKLEQAVLQYNALSDYTDNIRKDSIAKEQLDYVKAQSDKGIALLDEVIRTETGEMQATAKYFKTNFQFKYLFLAALKNGTKAIQREFDLLEADMNAYTEASFPLRYSIEGKNFIINFKNFAPAQIDFWLLKAELLRNKKNEPEQVLNYSRKVFSSSYSEDYVRVITAGFILEAKEGRKEYDKEAYDAATAILRDFGNLGESQQTFIKKNKFTGPAKSWSLIKEIVPKVAGSNWQQGEMFAESATRLSKINETTLATEAYQKAVQTGYSKPDFLFETADFALANNNNVLGTLAVSRLEQTTGETQCEILRRTGDYYQRLGNYPKADALRKRSEKCQKKQAKSMRTGGEGFHLYLGGYVFPAFKKNYGGVVNFVFPKAAIEFSYLNMAKKTENHMDLTTFKSVSLDDDEERVWSGFYTHIAPKFVAENNWDDRAKRYSGFLLGYAQKDFKPIVSNVTHLSDGAITSETFHPTGKQYIAMLNIGGIIVGKGFGLDMYASVGAAYNQFDGGHPSYDSEDYTIESAFLENRQPGYFTVAMRAGFTIGLCLGR